MTATTMTAMHELPKSEEAARMTGTTGRAGRMLRRLGIAGFTFFLVKGLLWLAVPAALWVLNG